MCVDTNVSSTALLHDNGQSVDSDLDLTSRARGVSSETIHCVSIVTTRCFGVFPVTRHIADVDRRTLCGVGADTSCTATRSAAFDGDGDAFTVLLIVLCPDFCKRQHRRRTCNLDGAIWSTGHGTNINAAVINNSRIVGIGIVVVVVRVRCVIAVIIVIAKTTSEC